MGKTATVGQGPGKLTLLLGVVDRVVVGRLVVCKISS